jgi:hypothetical protein
MSTVPPSNPVRKIVSIGQESSTISVEISARFLQHFSEQLYSSPQKAFEELISNGWDASDDRVDVRLSPDLTTTASTTLALPDNGAPKDRKVSTTLAHRIFTKER